MPETIRARIAGVGHYLPAKVVTSSELEDEINTGSDGFRIPSGTIQRLSGVVQRHRADESESAGAMAARAGEAALADAGMDPAEIDLIIFTAVSQDFLEPATANVVHEQMGCTNAAVMDVKNACNGFVNALDIAHAFIETGRARRVLVTSGEVIAPYVKVAIKDFRELAIRFSGLTVGDGAGACVVEATTDPDRGLLRGQFFSDGTQWRLATIMAGGSMYGRSEDDPSRWFFESDSLSLLKLGEQHIPEVVERALKEAGWERSDIDVCVPHQVSVPSTQLVCELVGIPFERCVLTLPQVGNTAASAMPIALSHAKADGRLVPGSKVLLVAAAGGFSTAAIPIVW